MHGGQLTQFAAWPSPSSSDTPCSLRRIRISEPGAVYLATCQFLVQIACLSRQQEIRPIVVCSRVLGCYGYRMDRPDMLMRIDERRPLCSLGDLNPLHTIERFGTGVHRRSFRPDPIEPLESRGHQNRNDEEIGTYRLLRRLLDV